VTLEEQIAQMNESDARLALRSLARRFELGGGPITLDDLESEIAYWNATPVFPGDSLGVAVDENGS